MATVLDLSSTARDRAPPPDRWQRLGDWLSRNRAGIAAMQWAVIVVYALLLVVPAVLPLPGNSATIWNDVTRLAQFVFWGLWWPGVILLTMLVGRVWCGFFCPEGALSEWASRHGWGGALPAAIKWPGWPVLGFALTTVYGQMTSVYQYPRPALLILGGSTLAAMAVGLLYGKGKRVWCRYLCPVSGVFQLLAKLSLFEFSVDPGQWEDHRRSGKPPGTVDCAPLVAIRTMKGAAACHMCGRCSGFRNAVRLRRRVPSREIIHVAGATATGFETVLILFGLLGLSLGAFQWSASPWFLALRQDLVLRLVDAGWTWPLETSLPWWLITDYPERNDVLSLVDGVAMLGYMGAQALFTGLAMTAFLAAATRATGTFDRRRFHHLAQAFIPLAAAGLVTGLSSLTVTQLRMDGIVLPGVLPIRLAILAAGLAFSLRLAGGILERYTKDRRRRATGLVFMLLATLPPVGGWYMLFVAWS